jgi:hypothetical protein
MDHFRLLLGRKHILDDLDIDVRHGLFPSRVVVTLPVDESPLSATV